MLSPLSPTRSVFARNRIGHEPEPVPLQQQQQQLQQAQQEQEQRDDQAAAMATADSAGRGNDAVTASKGLSVIQQASFSSLPARSPSPSVTSMQEQPPAQQHLPLNPSPPPPIAPAPPSVAYTSARGSSDNASPVPSAIPLHRRVHISGLSGRFLRGVVTALSGATAGSQHLLIDVTWTEASAQLDARRLAHFAAATGALFGLSCDMLVCHALTTAADLSHGAQVAAQSTPEHRPPPLDRISSMASSFSAMQNNHPRASPELGPTSQFLATHPPAAGSQPSAMMLGDLGSPLSVGIDRSVSHGDEDERMSSVPLPPPLPSHLHAHAPRRVASLDHIAAARQGAGGAVGPQHRWHQGSYGGGDVDEFGVGGGNVHNDTLDGLPHADSSFHPSHASSSSSSAARGGSGYTRGPIFSNIFIAHHLHCAPADVQAVLLQALKLKQISVDGAPVNLPAIHLCIATHSASVTRDGAGISPRLLDEFVLDLVADRSFFHSLEAFLNSMPRMHPSSLPIPWQRIRQLVNEDESSRGIFLSPLLGSYVRDIATAMRQHGRVALGPSAQGMQALIHAAKCHAYFGGSTFVRPVDIDSVCEDALCHRLLLRASSGPWSTPHAARMLITHMIGKVMLPPK